MPPAGVRSNRRVRPGPSSAAPSLAVLVIGGSALFGFLKPGLPDDWNSNKLVVSRESAPDDEIAGETIGDTIGIIGAPDTLPDPGEALRDGPVLSETAARQAVSRAPEAGG